MRISKSILLSAIAALLALSAAAQQTMPLSQIRKGMRGYGVTVFEGTRLDRFDVEILGVLNNIGPGQDLILAKVDSPTVQRAGVIAGMSGSPVYIDGKVIGARRYDVLIQFLIEAVTLSGIGGIIGIAGGYGTASAVRLFLKKWIEFPPVHTPLWAIVLAFTFCAVLGVIFGIYPAAKASKLDPIEALRYE